MFLDAQLCLSDAQAITASAASTNVVDLGNTRQLGVGEPMGIFLAVDTAADITTGDETYSFVIQTDDNAAFASPTNLSTVTLTAAQLRTGANRLLAMPRDGMERYLRLYYTTGGTTPSVTLTAFVTPVSAVGTATHYPSAFHVG